MTVASCVHYWRIKLIENTFRCTELRIHERYAFFSILCVEQVAKEQVWWNLRAHAYLLLSVSLINFETSLFNALQ